MPELERIYRRLLWAYPRFYRRSRGLEMLTTLMDAAEPGQTRPSRSDVIHLLLMGLRYRLVPPGWIAGVAAAIVTLWAAVVFSGAGALVAWAAADLSAPALDDSLVGRPATFTSELGGRGIVDADYTYQVSGEFQTFGAENWGSPRPAPIGQSRFYEAVPGAEAVLADAHRSLRSAGWDTGAVSAEGVFWAERDGVLVRMSQQEGHLTVSAYPVEPGGVLPAAITGFVAGLILTWMATTWLAHRTVRADRPVRRWIMLLGLPAVIAAAVNTFDNVMSVLPDPDSASVMLATDWIYPFVSQIANPQAVAVIGVALAGSLMLLRRSDRVPAPVVGPAEG
ncbi:hypothetical protein OHA21_19360 [Actinoplanes sp. NBC_00393]|uniref:hypothetical protein n=1 Tax=Actinoplanes sp. NBC_00393 TaxID=2975953 RepID=UPI002E2131A4